MAQIKKDTSLRKAILQAAITGQLISDIEGESLPLASASKLSSATPSAGASPATPPETGKEFLDRIIEERNNKLLTEWEEILKKNPKAKKPAPVVASEIDEEEIPFEIPENWCWCRFGEITINRDSERIPLSVSQRELLKKKYDYYGASGIIDKVDNYLFDKDLLLIGEDGANLLTRSTPIAFIASGKYWVNNHAHVIDCNSNYINLNYIKFFINAISLAKYVTGTAQPKMNQEKMNSIPVALPPLAVQNAIVAKLEQVLPLVDAYENALLQKEELKSALPDKVKKAILQEAITGQLTEAWRKSASIKESGKQLLDRIIQEKMSHGLDFANAKSGKKKMKKETALAGSNPCDNIPEDEIPFEVPESWCWCRLGDLGDFVRGSGIKRDETRPEGFPCIRYGEMYTRYKTVINETVSFVEKNVFDKCQKIIKNDIAMALTGENEYDIALAAVYTGDKEVAMGGDMTRFRPAFVNSLFLVFALNSPYGIECKSELATGNIIVHISNDKLGSIMIPLPPLEEQAEIVTKVEELLPLCK